MMKKLICAVLTASMLVSLTGCLHTHNFSEATCTEPMTCAECGATEGEPLGHTFAEATCDKAKTCTVCGATEGEPLGHTFAEATCDKAKTCTVCGATEGEPLGHTVSIGTCKRCGKSVNFDVVEDMLDDYKSAGYYLDTAYSYVVDTSASYGLDHVYRAYCNAYDYMVKYQNAMKKVAYTCDKYPELKKLSSALRDIRNYNIRMPASSSATDLVAFSDQLIDLLALDSAYATEAKNWANGQ